jgi:hypothetical protein
VIATDVLLHLTLPATGSAQIAEVLRGLDPAGPGLALAADATDDPLELARQAAAARDAGAAAVLLVSGPALLGGGALGPEDAAGLRPRAAQALTAVLSALGATIKARVVLDVRRQDRLMEHAHLDAVRRGSAVPFAEQFPRFREPVLDWHDLAGRVADVPGVAEVVLRPVEAFAARPERLAVDLLHRVGAPPAVTPAAVPDPPTFSARGVRVARALNAHLLPGEQALVRDFVAANFPGPPADNQFLRPRTRAAILAAYAAGNRALFRAWLPEFGADAYADDARTAALAPRENQS